MQEPEWQPLSLREPASALLAVLVAGPTAVAIGAWCFYVAGNGLTAGALALGTVPWLLIAIALAPLAVGPWRRRGGAVVAALLGFDVLFAGWRVAGVHPDGMIAYCEDGRCGVRPPFLASLVREDESAAAGIALSDAGGMLFPAEADAIGPALQAKYDRLAALQPAGANALLLSSSPDLVRELVYLPAGAPSDDTRARVPAIVYLHGFGGLLSTYTSALLESDELARYAIIAPALDNGGRWWTARGKAVVRRTLDTLPAAVDRDRVYLVGLSNGAVGATAVAADPELSRHVRAVVALVGVAGVEHFGAPRVPLAVIAGRADERFDIAFVDEAARDMQARGASVEVHRYDFDHLGPFTHTADVNAAIAEFLRAH